MSSIVPSSRLQPYDPQVFSISVIRGQIAAAHAAASRLTQHSVALASNTVETAYFAALKAQLSDEEWRTFEVLTREYLASMRYILTSAYGEIGAVITHTGRTTYLLEERR